VADGSIHRESDVDVGVVLQRGQFPDRLTRSQERVSLLSGLIEATGRNEIDLVVLNDAPPRFQRAVVLGGERLLCLDPEQDRLFRRDAQLLAADLDVFMRKMEPLKLEALRK
jgi:predicted nucleotidyltransferase